MPLDAPMMGASWGAHDAAPCYFCSWKKTMHLIGKIIFVLRKK